MPNNVTLSYKAVASGDVALPQAQRQTLIHHNDTCGEATGTWTDTLSHNSDIWRGHRHLGITTIQVPVNNIWEEEWERREGHQ